VHFGFAGFSYEARTARTHAVGTNSNRLNPPRWKRNGTPRGLLLRSGPRTPLSRAALQFEHDARDLELEFIVRLGFGAFKFEP
jgi:hypothetical protein